MAELPPTSLPEIPAREPFWQRLSPVAFVLLSLSLVFVLYQVVAGVLAFVLLGNELSVHTVIGMRVATAVGQIVCILIPTLLLARARYGKIVGPLRLKLPSLLDVVVVSVALIALQQLLQGYMAAQDAIPLPPQIERFVKIVEDIIERTYLLLVSADSPLEFAGVVVTVAFIPAIVEELLFRGLVQRDLEKVAGGLRAAIIAGVIFGVYHLNPFSIVPLVALGVFFGYVVYRSQNITLAMAAHFLNNFLTSCSVYFGLGDEYLVFAPGDALTAGSVALNSAVSALLFAGTLYYFARKPYSTDAA